MHLLQALLQLRLSDQQPLADGACVISIQPRAPAQQQQTWRGDPRCSNGALEGATTSSTPFSLGKALSKLAAGSSTVGPCCGILGTSSHLLESLPPPARSLIWDQLTSTEKRVVRCVSRPVCSCFNGGVGQLQVGGEV